MRLVDLDPRWFSRGQNNRVGLTFECPCCIGKDVGSRLAIALHLDGTNFDPDPANPQQFATNEHVWKVAGDSFENMTITPSVDASKHGHWHGFITNGDAK